MELSGKVPRLSNVDAASVEKRTPAGVVGLVTFEAVFDVFLREL